MPALSFPMYDWPELRAPADAWAAGVASHLRACGFADVPAVLQRHPDPKALWRSPDLLLSQCCGYPLTHEFSRLLVPILTPHYAVEGCSGPAYSSLIFVRAADGIDTLSDLRGRRPAVNDASSMSGMLALKLVFAPYADSGTFFAPAVLTGSHMKSLEAVQRGLADVCATDAVCVALARRHRENLLAGLVEIARSPLVPGLPYVASANRSADELQRMRRALGLAFSDDRLREAREALFLNGYSMLEREDYDVIGDLERDIEGEGGLSLWQAA